MVRRRIPLLVRDALNHPSTYKPMVEYYQTYCYVAAPIMPEGRVIGFIHADKGIHQIAAQLFITESTAKAHVGRILRELGAGNRVEAATVYHKSRSE